MRPIVSPRQQRSLSGLCGMNYQLHRRDFHHIQFQSCSRHGWAPKTLRLNCGKNQDKDVVQLICSRHATVVDERVKR